MNLSEAGGAPDPDIGVRTEALGALQIPGETPARTFLLQYKRRTGCQAAGKLRAGQSLFFHFVKYVMMESKC